MQSEPRQGDLGNTAGIVAHPLEILLSLCSWWLRQAGQYFLMANFCVIVRLFLVRT